MYYNTYIAYITYITDVAYIISLCYMLTSTTYVPYSMHSVQVYWNPYMTWSSIRHHSTHTHKLRGNMCRHVYLCINIDMPAMQIDRLRDGKTFFLRRMQTSIHPSILPSIHPSILPLVHVLPPPGKVTAAVLQDIRTRWNNLPEAPQTGAWGSWPFREHAGERELVNL